MLNLEINFLFEGICFCFKLLFSWFLEIRFVVGIRFCSCEFDVIDGIFFGEGGGENRCGFLEKCEIELLFEFVLI